MFTAKTSHLITIHLVFTYTTYTVECSVVHYLFSRHQYILIILQKHTECLDKENELHVSSCICISLLIAAQHVSGNHVPFIRSWRLRDIIALCWYVQLLQEGGQFRLVGSASMDGLFVKRTHPWTHYQPTGLDNLPAAKAHTNTRL